MNHQRHILNRNENYYVQISPYGLSENKEYGIESQNYSLDLTLVGAIALMGMAILLWGLFSPKPSNSLPKTLKDPTKSKCSKCRFFNSNSYLKCAVQPTKVFKKEAQECLDYESKQFKQE